MPVRLSLSLPARQVESSPCPGLFCPTVAQDGVLSRIRVPGGLLNAEQCRILAELSDRLGGSIDVTNRANLQIRGLREGLCAASLQQLRVAGLAANPETDHLRNIMASPAAGIDVAQRVDTRPFVIELDQYLSSQPQLAALSPKFSIGVDGGEQVSIAKQLNDLTFSAQSKGSDIYYRIRLRGIAPGQTPLLRCEDCLPFIATLAQVYLDAAQTHAASSPRLKAVIESVGSELFLQQVQSQLNFPWICQSAEIDSGPRPSVRSSALIGIHSQRQSGLAYLGIALPLGHLSSEQLVQIAALSQRYGSGTIRLTPWRNLLISDVPESQAVLVEQALKDLGLSVSATSPWGGLIACAGRGCAASATDIQSDAAAIAAAISPAALDQPLYIHLTGCAKSCANHDSNDLTLVGQFDDQASYQLFIGDLESPFGRPLMVLSPEEVPSQLLRMLQVYQKRRATPTETFCAFANRWPVAQLQEWMIDGRDLRTNHA